MKKFLSIAVAIVALALTSCGNSVKADLQDNVDSLAYNLGLAQASGLKQYMQMQLHVDTAYVDEFIKGIKQGALNEPDPKGSAYYKGVEIGQQVAQMAENLSHDVYSNDTTGTQTVGVKNLLAGIVEGLQQNISQEEAQAAYETFQALLAPIQEQNLLDAYGDNKAAGEAYLAMNAKKEGVVVTESGLQYVVLEPGTGDVPADTTVVEVLYEGRLIDGEVFDSNTTEGKDPLKINMKRPRVVAGFEEAVKGMPLGAKWEVTIPQELAYGERGQGQLIKPFSALIFTIERIK